MAIADRVDKNDPRVAGYQEESTRSMIRMCAGFSPYLKESSEEYITDLQDMLNKHIDTIALDKEYAALCSLLGDQVEMRKLLDLLMLRFQATSMAALYWHGSSAAVCSQLLERDVQTSRCVYQILLDDPSLVL